MQFLVLLPRQHLEQLRVRRDQPPYCSQIDGGHAHPLARASSPSTHSSTGIPPSPGGTGDRRHLRPKSSRCSALGSMSWPSTSTVGEPRNRSRRPSSSSSITRGLSFAETWAARSSSTRLSRSSSLARTGWPLALVYAWYQCALSTSG